ncbi:MAG: hypothetical protein GEU79_10510, partial [Acidimicrobiia bacterium]|nr:hypothetical protein [Acidimicrobiia bacterium]
MSTERVAPTATGEVLIPALFAIFMNLAAIPLWYVLFSGAEERGAGAPWPGSLALFALAAYVVTRMVGVGGYSLGVHILGWLVGLAIWTLLEPAY